MPDPRPRQRNLRLSQTIAPFGVGAIYDILGESLISCDTSIWKGAGVALPGERLGKFLGGKSFRMAPWSVGEGWGTSNPHGRLTFMRFPRWLFCPMCRRMYWWDTRDERKGRPAECVQCGQSDRKVHELVPMRWVMACEKGHLWDVPWDHWVHMGKDPESQKQCRTRRLRFLTRREAGSGLQSLEVKCDDCGARRTLDQLEHTRRALKCRGRQPWQLSGEGISKCGEDVVIVQRGAANIYFAEVRSALDIPPESDYDPYSDRTIEIANHANFTALVAAPDGPAASLLAQVIANEIGCTVDEVMVVVRAEVAEREGHAAPVLEREPDLYGDEWRALVKVHPEHDHRDAFVTEMAEFPGESSSRSVTVLSALGRLIHQVILVQRLREVRALIGFSRVTPGKEIVPPDLGKGVDWLPAVEIFGEGIFIQLDEDYVAEWERNPAIRSRAEVLDKRRQGSIRERWLPPATPRFLLLHTFAHMLIRRLAYESGYASAALSERIYSREPGDGASPMAGILVYTAAGDMEGTMGGLVRQGRPPRFLESLMGMLESAITCSSDPICIESDGQGVDGLNLGACHACTLVSETTCQHGNLLLDRNALVGADGLGFFIDVLEAVLEAGAEQEGT